MERNPRSAVIGLPTSCATPAASRPTLASRSLRATSSRAARSSRLFRCSSSIWDCTRERSSRRRKSRRFPPGKRPARGTPPPARRGPSAPPAGMRAPAAADDGLRHGAQPRPRAGHVAAGDLVASLEEERHGQHRRAEQAGSDQDRQQTEPQTEAALAHPKNLSSASKYHRYSASPASKTSRAASARNGPNGTAWGGGTQSSSSGSCAGCLGGEWPYQEAAGPPPVASEGREDRSRSLSRSARSTRALSAGPRPRDRSTAPTAEPWMAENSTTGRSACHPSQAPMPPRSQTSPHPMVSFFSTFSPTSAMAAKNANPAPAPISESVQVSPRFLIGESSPA